MRNSVLAALVILFVAGGLSVAAAQTDSERGDRAKIPPTPSYTYKGDWYGLITCNKLQRQGHAVKPDDVKKCVANGGEYVFLIPGRMDVLPQAKVAPFAGQQVWITGTVTSTTYGTGPTSDQSIQGLYAGGDRPATRFVGITVQTIKPTVRDDAMVRYDKDTQMEVGSRVAGAAQK